MTFFIPCQQDSPEYLQLLALVIMMVEREIIVQVTTPDDMMVAEGLLSEHRVASQQHLAALQPA